MRTWLGCCLVVLLPFFLEAQTPTVQERVAKAEAALERGDGPRAAQLAHALYDEQVRSNPTDGLAIGRLELWVGSLYLQMGRYEDAESWTRKAFDRWKAPAQLAEQPQAALQLAKVYLEAEWYDGAEQFLVRSLEGYRKQGSAAEVHWMEAQTQYAGYCLLVGRLDEAVARYDSVIALQGREPIADLPALAFSLNNLAAVQRAQGRSDIALGTYQHALNMLVNAYGAEALETSTTLTNIAVMQHDNLEEAEAERNLVLAYNIRKQRLPLHDPLVLGSLDNLIQFYADNKQQAKAEQLLLEAKQSRERVYGGDSPAVAEILDRFANLHIALQHLPTAEQYWILALQVRENAYGVGHEMVAANLYNLAKLENMLGKHDQARIHLNSAKYIYENQPLGNEEQICAIFSEFFLCDYMQGKFDAAEEHLEMVRTIKEQVYGPKHPQVRAVKEEQLKFYRLAGWDFKADALQKEIDN